MTAIDTATEVEVRDRLTHGQHAARLPLAFDIAVVPQIRHAVVLLVSPGHDLTDLHTWNAWLRTWADPVKDEDRFAADVSESSRPGHIQRRVSAEATWRGWTVVVRLVETIPVEQVAVAFGGAR